MSVRTHQGVVTTAIRAPLAIHQVPTPTPVANEVLIRNLWTASTPLDLHQNDGGLLVTHPQILGDGTAGIVAEVGEEVKGLKVGDQVFGFTWRNQKEKAHQEYVCAPENLLAKLADGFTLQEAVVLGNNFVTAMHTITADLQLPLPWPKPASYKPPHAQSPILVWGGSSSVGQYALQILKHFGYGNLMATASPQHHALLTSYGATQTFNYRDEDVVQQIDAAASNGIPFIIDCIGSLKGSIAPLTRIAGSGSKVAILLPVIVRDATADAAPEYAMDVVAAASSIGSPWANGVEAVGVRTHFYLQNKLFADKLQSEIMPTALREGWVKPNKVRNVEGKTLLVRAQKAMNLLRDRAVSGERLVWRVSQDDGS